MFQKSKLEDLPHPESLNSSVAQLPGKLRNCFVMLEMWFMWTVLEVKVISNPL